MSDSHKKDENTISRVSLEGLGERLQGARFNGSYENEHRKKGKLEWKLIAFPRACNPFRLQPSPWALQSALILPRTDHPKSKTSTVSVNDLTHAQKSTLNGSMRLGIRLEAKLQTQTPRTMCAKATASSAERATRVSRSDRQFTRPTQLSFDIPTGSLSEVALVII